MLYLFFGSNDLIRSEAVAELKAAIPADVQDMNVTTLDGRKLKLAALQTACEAFPFLHDRRLVIVEEALKNLRAGAARDGVRAYLPQVPETTDLLFIEGDDFDKRSPIFTYLKKEAVVREFQPYQGAELMRWLLDRAQRRERKLLPEAAQLVIDFAGNNCRALLSEVDKLAAYAAPGEPITAAMVQLLVADARETSIFTFIDMLSARRLGPALQLVRSLLDDGEAPTYLLFMIGRQVRLLLQIAELSKSRMRPDAIAVELGQKPFVVRKAMDIVSRFSGPELVTLHDRLVEFDHWSKTGQIEGTTALELFVAEACS